MLDTETTQTGLTTRSARPAFFVTSGPVPSGHPGYLRRDADDQVAAGIAGATFVNLVGPPMSGKSSLLARVADAQRESDEAPVIALIDCNQLLQREGRDDVARTFYAIAYRIARQLRVPFDLQTWWSEHSLLPHHQRFFEFFRECALSFSERRLLLLFDDIQHLLRHDNGEQLLSAFRLSFDARATDPALTRLTILFAGNGDGQFGRQDSPQLPYAIAARVQLRAFTLGQTLRMAPALGVDRAAGELAMQRIYDWVSGQPALTQYLAHELAATDAVDDIVAAVDGVVQRRFLGARDRRAHAAMLAMQDEILTLEDGLRTRALIKLGRIAKHRRELFDPLAEEDDVLLRSGIVELGADGFLDAANRLSRRYFNAGWANQHLPMTYGGLLKAAAVVALLFLAPLWYQAYLPRPYVAAMTDPTADLETLIGEQRALARWPGYAEDARRIALAQLEQRAIDTDSAAEITELAETARSALSAPERADHWLARFWLRRSDAAAQRGRRIEALVATLRALRDDKPAVRQRLAGLIGSDLPGLTHALQTPAAFTAIRYRPRDRALVTLAGVEVSEWPLRGDTPIPEIAGSVALEAMTGQPVVYRSRVAAGAARDLVIDMQLQHGRLTDLEMTISNPDGISARLPLGALVVAGSSARVRLSDVETLRPLLQGTTSGEWTLSLTDTRPGVDGSAALVITPADQALELPALQRVADPLLVTAGSVHLSRDGRIGVAMPEAPADRVVVYDLVADTIVGSVAVAESARFVGIIANGQQLLLADGADLFRYRLVDMQRVSHPVLDQPAIDVRSSPDGRWLAVTTAREPEVLQLVDLVDNAGRRIELGSDHSRLLIDDAATLVAAIDADQVIRVWRVADGRQIASLPLDGGVLEASFAPSAEQLIVRLVGGGMLSWSFTTERAPELWDERYRWHVSHDPQSGYSLVGAATTGFRVHDFALGRDRSVPILGLRAADRYANVLRLRQNFALIAAPDAGLATVWRPTLAALPVGARLVRRAWLSDDGSSFAFSDRRDSFSVLRMDAGAAELDTLDAPISTVAHSRTPTIVRFTRDGAFALSIESNGLFRVRDVVNGEFFDFIGRAASRPIDARFSDDGAQFMILGDRQFEVYATRTGSLLHRQYRDVDLVAMSDLMASNGWLLSDRNGTLLFQAPIVAGQPPALIERPTTLPAQFTFMRASGGGVLAIANGDTLEIVNSLAPAVAPFSAQLGAPISEMSFSANREFLIVRAGQWLHRIDIAGRLPQLTHSRLLPADMLAHAGFAIVDGRAMQISLLRGLDEPVPHRIAMDYADVAPPGGSLANLQSRWDWLVSLVEPDLPAAIQ